MNLPPLHSLFAAFGGASGEDYAICTSAQQPLFALLQNQLAKSTIGQSSQVVVLVKMCVLEGILNVAGQTQNNLTKCGVFATHSPCHSLSV